MTNTTTLLGCGGKGFSARFAICAALVLMGVSVAWGATYTWVGTAGGGDGTTWTNLGNWTGGTNYPGFASGDTANFNSPGSTINIGSYSPAFTDAIVNFTAATTFSLGLDVSLGFLNFYTSSLVTVNLNNHTLNASWVNFGQTGAAHPPCNVVINGPGTLNAATIDTNENQNNVVYLVNSVTLVNATTFWGNQNNGTTTTFHGDGTSSIYLNGTLGSTSSVVFDDVVVHNGTDSYSLSTVGAVAAGQTVTVTISGSFPSQQFRYYATRTGADAYSLTDQSGLNGVAVAIGAYTAFYTSGPSFQFHIVFPAGVAAGNGLCFTIYPSASNLPIGSVNFVQSATSDVWLGVDTNWNNAANWSIGLPTAATNVTIPVVVGAQYPSLTGSPSANTITVELGASMAFNGINVSGLTSIANFGTVKLAGTESLAGVTRTTGPASTVDYGGTGSPVWGASYVNLTLDGAASISSAASLTVSGTLVDNGSLDMAGNTLSFATCSGGGSISTSSGTITATGTGGTIASLNVSGGATINGGATGLAITNQVAGNLSLTGAVTLNGMGIGTLSSGGSLTLNGGLQTSGNASLAGLLGGANSLIVGGNATFSGVISGLSTLSVSGTTAINTTSITTSGTQGYTLGVTLGASATLTASTVTFGATVVGGANSLAISGNAIFDNTVSGLTTLSVSGTTAINTASITTSGTQGYTLGVTLGTGTTLTASTVTFGATIIGGANSLGISGNAIFDNTVSALATLSVSGTSAINTASITTSGTQGYTLGVSLGAGTILTASTVTFSATVVGGANSLGISGNAIFDNTVSALATLSVSGTTAINTTSITTSGTQGYTLGVSLGTGTTLTASTVTFGATVVGGANSLGISGNAIFDNTVSALTTLSVSGTTAINTASITTSGAQGYTLGVTLGAGTTLTASTVTFSATIVGGANSLAIIGNAIFDNTVSGITNLSVSGTSAINTASITTSGTQGYTLGVTLGANTVLSNTTVSFGAGVSGTGFDLRLTSTGGLTLALGSITGVRNFAKDGGAGVTAGGNLTTTGTQNWTDALTLNAATVLSGTIITFSAGLIGGANSLGITGNAIFDNTVSALATLSVSGTTAINTASITTSGIQGYTLGVTLGAGTTLTASTVTFSATVVGGANSLGIIGNAIFDNTVSALSTLSVSGTTAINTASITTSGTQGYTLGVTLGTSATLIASTVTFSATVVGGANSLGISGNAIFDNTVSALTTLSVSGTSAINTASITTSGTQGYTLGVTLGTGTTLTASTVTFGATVVGGANSLAISGNAIFDNTVSALTTLSVSGTSAINTASITTSGTQGYTLGVSLGAGTTLTASAVTFSSTVVGGANSLGISGNAIFDNTVSALTTLSVSGTSAINTASITTSGTQGYTLGVILGTGTTLTASTVTFGATVVGGANSLAITGNAIFDNTVSALSTLSVSGTSAINTASITTSGTQGYTLGVTLGTGTTLTASTVTFGATVNGGANSLGISGNAIFDNTVSALTTLSVSGTTAINTASITTSGAQGYTLGVSLGAGTTLTASTVIFSATVAGGANSLAITGNAIFDNTVSALTTLSVSGTSAINTASITTSGTQGYTLGVTLGTGTTLTASTVTFSGAVVGGANSLAITGNAIFGNTVSALTTLSVSGTSAINTASITTSGTQGYTLGVTLGASTTLTASTVTFSATVVGGANSLAITGNAIFDNTVSALTTLSVSGTTAINTASIATSGTQGYTLGVSLGTGTTLTASTVTFSATVVGGANSLGITGNAIFNNTVSGLTTLGVSGTTALNADITSSGLQSYQGPVTLGASVATVAGAGSISFGSTVGPASLILSIQSPTSTGTVTFTGAVTLQGLTTGAGGYAIAINGGGTISNALSFDNSGGVTIGNGLTANAGLTSTSSVSNTFQGTVSTGGGGNISVSSLSVGSANLTLDAGSSDFLATGNIIVDAANLVVSAASINAAAATLSISPSSASRVVDIGSSNFTIGQLINGTALNPGRLRLTGAQTVHSISAYDVSHGIVEYYGAAGGRVFTTGMSSAGTNYCNLQINGNSGIVFTLEGDATVANDLTITQGVLSAIGTPNKNIGIGGNWQNIVGVNGFLAGSDNTVAVSFTKGSGAILVSGDNRWCVFKCTVPGATILFENARIQHISPSGIFWVNSAIPASRISLSRQTPPVLPPGLPGLTNLPSSQPSPAEDAYVWFFDLQPGAALDMDNVDLYFSNARADPISVPSAPASVAATPYASHFCFKWLDIAYSIYSYTEDSDYNGKIDRIRVTTESQITTASPDFSGFKVEVQGYEIDASKGSYGYSVPGSGFTYFIYLKEKPYNDTGITPDWRIVSNTSFAAGGKLIGTVSRQGGSDWMTPGDTAWPRIGYTLAIPGLSSSFVHLSEAVTQAGGAAPTAADLGSTGGGMTAVTSSGAGIQEAVIVASAAITAPQIELGSTNVSLTATLADLGQPPHWEAAYSGQVILFPEPTYPPLTGYTTTPDSYVPFAPMPQVAPLTLPSRPGYFNLQRGGLQPTSHRISDAMVSLPPPTSGSYDSSSYFAWPIYARDQVQLSLTDSEIASLTPAQSAAEGIGLIRAFDGTQWLRAQGLVLQMRTSEALGNLTPSIVYDTNVASTYKGSDGLWLPSHLETDFSGLDGYPDSLTGLQSNASSTGSQLWDLSIPSTDPKVKDQANNSIFDFYMRLSTAPSDLYAGRLDMASGAGIPSDWYRRVRPFSFFFHDVVLQRGGVTILNNVIDPTKGETARLSYQLASSGSVTVTVFTLDGDVVARIVNSGSQDAGDHSASWNGRNLAGNAVARGIYFIRIVAPGMDEIRKVLVVRK